MTAERFLTLSDVAEILNISASQTYALVRSGDLQGIQIGGRNQWRVERTKLEEYIEQAYRKTASNLSELPSTLPSDVRRRSRSLLSGLLTKHWSCSSGCTARRTWVMF